MREVRIKIDSSTISPNINKKQLKWAVNFLKRKINTNYISKNKNIECILVDHNSQNLNKYLKINTKNNIKESFLINPIKKDFSKVIIYGYDTRGLIYAITEIADRIENRTEKKLNLKKIFKKTSESPKTKIRSISKCFVSDIEDLKWFYNKTMWEEYLDMLISNRFNRFTFTLGMQYNYPYGNEFIKDVYFYLAYPFLVKPQGYEVYAEGINKQHRDKNLKMLKFISDEASKRGLDFQLAIWTQRYDFNNVPNANYQIKNIPKNYAEYCSDSLLNILKSCPSISGITLRVHVECGIPERDYKFWEIYFNAIKKLRRNINLDLHAKGIDNKLINLALNVTQDVTVSPKYIAEHMGLPYHQTSIRKQEMPPKIKVDKKWIFSEGERKFLRYSYGDLLTNKRKYGILFRIWPGTQRVLIWGDPDLARGYGKHSSFCNSLGVELCEPLSFKGRMGAGIKNGRFNYSKKKLRTKYDWQKYIYTYKVWGRCVYNYETDDDNYGRYFRKKFGKASGDLIHSLSYSSKILPFFTLVHGVSASNNSYWPEIYENMSTVDKAPNLPYSYDLHKPSRFGMATSQDPQLIMSPFDFATCIYKNNIIKKYSPITMSNWLKEYSLKSNKFLLKAVKKNRNLNTQEFRRLEIDIKILSSIGIFFSYKIRSSCYWELYIKSKNQYIGKSALKYYNMAYNAWYAASNISRKYYFKDLTYGPQSWLRGRWDDRLPAIKADIIKMKNILKNNKSKKFVFKNFDKIKNWKNNQQFKIQHKINIKNNGNIEIYLDYKKRDRKKLYVNFRSVNQSYKWKKSILILKNNKYFGKILKKNFSSEFPIQYYFELIDNNISLFCPGINKNLSNQPYYIINND